MVKSIMGQMEDAYQKAIIKGWPFLKVSRKLRRDYGDALFKMGDAQLKEKSWIFLKYNGVGIVPEDSSFWKERLKR